MDSHLLRMHLKKGDAGLKEDCDILIDQIRAIDNKRLIKRTGALPVHLIHTIQENLKIIMDIPS